MRDLYSKKDDRGRGGVKNPENFNDVICTWPLNTLLGTSAELVPHKSLRNHVAFQSPMSRKICLRFKIGLNETTHVGLGLAMDRLPLAQRHLE